MYAITALFFIKNTYRILAFFSVTVLLFISNFSYALVSNPGATCPSGFAQGSFTSADYANVVSNVNSNTHVNIAGNASGKIPLQIKLDTAESSANTTLSNFGVIASSDKQAINIRRTFPTVTDFTDITFSFRNRITLEPIYLTNFALSAFDIDYANSNGNTFDDYVKVTGTTQTGNTIESVPQSISGSNINYSQGLYTTSAFNCPAKNFGTECQGSIRFSQPVKSVTIRYTNTGRLSTTSNQEIDLRIDNYCYAPRYFFSGTVFNDNGGINDNDPQVRADNATINSGVYNNINYFNGTFEAALETGIADSSVKLSDCANPNTVYASKSVVSSGTNIGQYQLEAPVSSLNGNTNVCLIETRSGTTYPINTNSHNKPITFMANMYNYPNNDFGRVIDKNVALVLKKYQYVHECRPTLDYSRIRESSDPRIGFSTSPINDIAPDQCIAYKITATNRANININDFVMRDTLQKKGVNQATVTSVLTLPLRIASDYADSLTTGDNGTVVTKPFTVNKRSNRSFYFNTKYGTSQSP